MPVDMSYDTAHAIFISQPFELWILDPGWILEVLSWLHYILCHLWTSSNTTCTTHKIIMKRMKIFHIAINILNCLRFSSSSRVLSPSPTGLSSSPKGISFFGLFLHVCTVWGYKKWRHTNLRCTCSLPTTTVCYIPQLHCMHPPYTHEVTESSLYT